ncbi:MAG: GIY-YIG nuclease family protein [Bacteroidia bacterium]|nr:GIY-YIG nuclease family protein [Bacteroidia bacterium]
MYSIIDIETTGGYALRNRITEIAIFKHDGEKIIDEFHSLINPEQHLPPYITKLTGITDEMLEDAPRFYEVAKEIMLFTRDSIFVAHNVGFDYGFVREEFKSLGADFSRPKLCTVRMSRKIFPGHASYSLGNLCNALGIEIHGRHRAKGDAEATVKLFERLLENDAEGFIAKAVKRHSREATLPPNLPTEVFEKIPEDTGVYYFHDAKGKVIYVGKAIDIRKRVLSHFTDKKKRLSFLDQIHDITWTITGGELIALLLESDEIKKLFPIYNQAQKRTGGSFGLFHYEDKAGIQRLHLGRKQNTLKPVAAFKSFESGRSYVMEMVRANNLCPKCCGLQKTPGPCFDFQIKKCKGVCAGKEEIAEYNQRVAHALDHLLEELGDRILIDKGRRPEEKAIVVVEKGVYKGFGYVDRDTPISTLEEASAYIRPYPDNADIRKILRNWIE